MLQRSKMGGSPRAGGQWCDSRKRKQAGPLATMIPMRPDTAISTISVKAIQIRRIQ